MRMRSWWLSLLPLFLVGCATKGNWKLSHVQSGSAKFNSSKLTYLASDKLNGIDLEILCTQTSSHAFVNVHSHPIKPYKGDPKVAYLTVRIGEESIPCLAARHEGGHRLLLPQEIQDAIIQALYEQKTIVLETSGYKSELEPQDFSKKYQKLKKPPSFSNPFHLPF
jgi:hypothetical protein